MTPAMGSERDGRPQSLAIAVGGALIAAVCVVAVNAPVLGRSVWADEAMLFSNYPLASIGHALRPLPFYDQAATPAYSIAVSWLADASIPVARGASLGMIAFLIALTTTIANRTWLAALVSTLCLTAFLEPLIIFSELKHYGLEAAGVVLSTLWFEYKDSRTRFAFGDAALLVCAMLLGISTLITACVALGLFFAVRLALRVPVKAGELALGAAVLAASVGYYLLIRHITQFQIANYTDAYSHVIGPVNVSVMVDAVMGVVGRQGLALSGLAIVAMAMTRNDPRSQRLLLIVAVTAVAFLFVSFLSLYPATNSRHMNWTAALFVAVLFAGMYRGLCLSGTARLAAVVVAVAVLGATARTSVHLWRDSFEVTANSQAISFLRAQAASAVGLWVAAQPVLDYYERLEPEIGKHSYFGRLNRTSAVTVAPSLARTMTAEQYNSIRDLPGAWGRTLMLRASMDYAAPAAALVAEAPRDAPFFVLASHYDLQARGGYPQARVAALEGAFAAASCDVDIVQRLRRVVVYRASCPQQPGGGDE